MYRCTKSAATGLLLALVAAGTFAAGKSVENDAIGIGATKITLSEAISAAEKHVSGKAARAELERSTGRMVFDVEVVSGSKTYDVKIDPDQGTVLASTEDRSDHDDDGDRED